MNLVSIAWQTLYAPLALAQAVQAELVGNLRGIHRIRQVLLVCEHKEEGITELVFVEHALELLTSLRDTLAVIRVNHEDDTLSVLEV